MNKTKVLLFLDLEGVTHPILETPFNNKNMRYLEKLLDEYPKLYIVITSSLREEYSVTELKEMLGVTIGSRVVGATPVIHDVNLNSIRYREVISYLEMTNNKHTDWLAIDDSPIFYLGAEDSMVITNPNTGLSEDEYLKIKTRLNILNVRT